MFFYYNVCSKCQLLAQKCFSSPFWTFPFYFRFVHFICVCFFLFFQFTINVLLLRRWWLFYCVLLWFLNMWRCSYILCFALRKWEVMFSEELCVCTNPKTNSTTINRDIYIYNAGRRKHAREVFFFVRSFNVNYVRINCYRERERESNKWEETLGKNVPKEVHLFWQFFHLILTHESFEFKYRIIKLGIAFILILFLYKNSS